jgi:hypothetical protein
MGWGLRAHTVRAQYLYLDANGDGVHTASDALSPGAPTTIDVWIDTDSNRDGSPAVCPSGDGDLTINSYEVILRAANGTVAWGSFTNLQPDFVTSFGQSSSTTDLYAGFGGGVILPPGLYHLATLQVSIASGTPSLAVGSSTPLGSTFLTSFGSRCSGNDLDNTLKLGSDWFDVDGLPYGGVANQAPALAQPDDMEAFVGSVTHQTIHGSDPDGQPLQFSKVSGPHYMAVTTVSPGAGSASGDVALTPLQSDVGSATGSVAASDGIVSDQKSFSITVAFGCGEGLCFEDRIVSSSQIPIDARAGDLNGDLLLDLVTVHPRSCEIRMGRGDGTFLVPTTLSIVPQPGRIWDTEVADMNGDGRSDLVVTSDPTQLLDQYYTIHIFLSRGDGTFQEMARYQRDPSTLDHFGPRIEVGDLNGDARTDVVVPRSGGKVTVFLGSGDGTLGPAADWVVGPFNAHSAGLADVDGDGNLDIVSVGSGFFAVLLGRGDGTFVTRPVRIGPLNGGFLAADDLNSDGRDDFALYGGGDLFPGDMGARIFLGASDGTPVQGPPLHIAGITPGTTVFRDMTGDGILDAVVTSSGFDGQFGASLPPRDGYLSVHVGDGTGAFGDRTDIPAPTYFGWTGMTTGDWDSDGKTDVVVVHSPSSLVRLLLNRGYRPHSDRAVSIYGVTRIDLTEGITSIRSFHAEAPHLV